MQPRHDGRGWHRSPDPRGAAAQAAPAGLRHSPSLPADPPLCLRAEAEYAAADAAIAAQLQLARQSLAAAQAKVEALSDQADLLELETDQLRNENRRLRSALRDRDAEAGGLRRQVAELSEAAQRLMQELGGFDASQSSASEREEMQASIRRDADPPPAAPPTAATSPSAPRARRLQDESAVMRLPSGSAGPLRTVDDSLSRLPSNTLPQAGPRQQPDESALMRLVDGVMFSAQPPPADLTREQSAASVSLRPPSSVGTAALLDIEARARLLFRTYDRNDDGRWGYEEARRFWLHTTGTQLDPQEWIAQCVELGGDPSEGLSCADVVSIYAKGLWGADVGDDCTRIRALESRVTEVLLSVTTRGQMWVAWRRLRGWPAASRALRHLRQTLRASTLELLCRAFRRLQLHAASRRALRRRSPSPQPPPRAPRSRWSRADAGPAPSYDSWWD